MPIRLKLIIMFLAVATVPLLFVGLLTFHNYRDALEANHLSQLQNIAAYKADKIETYFAGLKADMEIARGFSSVRQYLPVLARFATEPNNPEFIAAKKPLDDALPPRQSILKLVDILLTDTQGRVVYSSNPEHFAKYFLGPLPDPEQRSFDRGKNAIYITDVFSNKAEGNRLAMLVSAPVSDFNGAFTGVIVFDVDMAPVYKLVQDTTGLGNTGETLIGKKIGNEAVFLNPLRHDPNAALVRRTKLGDEFGFAIQQAVQNKQGAGQYLDYRGKKVIGAWRYIPSLDWGMVAKIDSEEAFADVTNLRNLVAIILGIVVVLSGITALSIAQSISVPIKRLSEGARIIGSGNLDYKIGTNLKDEVGQLSRSFDKMTADLKRTVASRDELTIEVRERKQTEAALRQSEARFKSLADNVPSILMRYDRQFRVVYLSQQSEAITGVPVAQFLGKTNREVGMPEALCARWEEAIGHVFRTGENRDLEFDFPSPQGPRSFYLRLAPEKAADGSIEHVLGVSTDITERKQAERERETTIEFLGIINGSSGTRDLIEKVTTFFHEQSGCETVGIRLKEGGDYPYYEHRGFPNEFIKLENSLCTYDLNGQLLRDDVGNPIIECMCGNVICGRFDPKKPFFTRHGSFWTNCTTELLATTSEADRQARTRNRCNGQGYESVALLPLRFGDQRLGLLQLNDKQKGKFSLETIQLWEGLTDQLATAIAKFRAEEALRESEERLERSQEIAHLGSWELDVVNDRLTWSDEVYRIFGLQPQEFDATYEAFLEYVHPDDRAAVDAAYSGSIRDGKDTYEIEHRVVRKDTGEIRFVHEKCEHFRDAAGKIIRSIGMVHDITARKQAEARLAADLAALTRMHQLSRRSLEAGGLPSLLQEVMDAAVAIMGAEKGTLQLLEGDSLRIVAHHGHQPPFLDYFANAENRASACGEALKSGGRVIVPDVEDSPVFVGTPSFAVLREAGVRAVQSTPMFSRAGALLGILTTHWGVPYSPGEHDLWRLDLLVRQASDLIESARAEAALRESEERFRGIVETAGEGIATHKPDGTIAYVNQRMADLLGYSREEIIGRASLDFVDDEEEEAVIGAREGLKERGGFNMERKLRRKDGSILWTLVNASPQRDSAGNFTGYLAMHTDITARKQAAEQIEMLARFPSENPSPVLRIASDGTILYSNGPGLALLEQWNCKVGEQVPPNWCKQAAQTLNTGRNIVREIKCGQRILSLVLAPVAKGAYVNLYGRDITKERKAELALRRAHAELEKKVHERTAQLVQTVGLLREEAEQRMQAQEAVKAERQRFNDVLETLPAYVCLLTPDYYMPFANRVFREWFGYYPDKKCYEFLFNRTEPCETCETFTVLKTNKSHHWEWTGPNGRNYDIFDFPFEDTDGSQLILEMGIDVTEQKRMQEELRSVSLYTRSLIEASLDPLVTISPDGRITDVSDATIKVTGVSREQLVGTDFSNYFTEPQKAREGYQQVFAKGFVTDYPLTIRHRDGRLTDVLYNATVYKDSRGNVAGVFAAARDITEKRITEQELEKYRMHLEDLVKQRTQELARSNKDLEQFAYVASHDLQEPLRAVAGFVELLKRNLQSSLDTKTTQYMNFTVDGAMRMQSLISGLLEYSRIGTRGKEPKRTDAGAALGRAMANLRMSIEESGAKITSDGLPTVHFDDVQLSQLFQNLIGNAIKFRTEQAPRIHIRAVRLDDSWRFAVEDNGIGIDPQYAERIFLIFQRLHNREKYPGTGIGLSICKKIVERHNGKIWVESKAGNGSTFYFTIPDKGGAAE